MINNKKFIPLSIPYLNGHEKKYTLKCYQDNWLSSAGPYIQKFEKKFASFIGAKHAIACSSGTASLHLALKAINVAKGDLVIVPDLTFIASINAIKYVNADPILIDADFSNWQIDLKALQEFLDNKCFVKNKKCIHKETGKKISAIIVVHILGYANNLDKIKKLSKEFMLPIIEDAAEALGTKYNKKLVGTIGAIGCFSFNGNKLITTGSGGMVVTNNQKYANIMRHLSQQAKLKGDDYLHSEIGFNYRMSNIQASLGIAQLLDIKSRITKKKKIFSVYKKAFSCKSFLFLPTEISKANSSYWLTTVRINKKIIKKEIKVIIEELSHAGIETRRLWQPMHLSKPHKSSIYVGDKNSEKIYNSSISLPSSVGLTTRQQEKVIKVFLKTIGF